MASVVFEISASETTKIGKGNNAWVHKCLSSRQYIVLGHKIMHTGGYLLDTEPS